MKHFVETSWFTYYFKENHTRNKSESNKWSDGIWEHNYWNVDRDSVREGLAQLSEYCDEHGYEIKGIVPIDRASSYEYGQAATGWDAPALANGIYGWGWGLGKGWGITMTDGFSAILQRVELLTDEEYQEKVNAVKVAKEEKMRREQEIMFLEDFICEAGKKIKEKEEELDGFRLIINKGIVEKTKGLMKKKTIFKVGDEEFEDVDHAKKYMDDLKSMTDDYEKTINQMREEVNNKKTEILS